MTLVAASCFSGIGAPELGGPEFDWKWCAEIEKFPAAVLAARFPQSVNLGDVTVDDFIERALAFGPLDLLAGGPPCQDFSVAGLRAGMAGDRGNLTLRFLEIAHAIRPRNLLVENVPGWLNMPDNAFGSFLGGLVGADDALRSPLDGKWPSAGMVAGPRARAAWRVFDAQYFGVAQRRRRVFVVADFGEGADPAAVLFERKSVSGNYPPSRENGQGTAGTISARTQGGGGLGTDFEIDGCLTAISFGGNNTSGPIDTATALSAHGGPHGRIDFESETFVATITGTLPAGGNRTGGDRPPGMGQETADTMLIAETAGTICRDSFSGGAGGRPEGAAAGHYVPVAHAYRTTGNCGAWDTGDKVGALTQSTDPNSVVMAIQGAATRENTSSSPDGKGWRDDDTAYTLEARSEVQAVAFALRGREQGAQVELSGAATNALRAAEGGSSRDYVSVGWQVRRLTPTECARLQGFPDDHCAIEYRGKPAADGPIYKSYGNSWAKPNGRWIINRIARQLVAMDKRRAAA